MPLTLIGMSQNQPKFNSVKDYYQFFPNQRFVKSLMAICLGRIANDVKDNIDPQNFLASKTTIEVVFSQLQELKISPNCLLHYWNFHTQPTWEYATVIERHVRSQCSRANFDAWYDSTLKKIGILNNDIVSYKPAPFSFDCITATHDAKYVAVSFYQMLVIFLNQHCFPAIYVNRTDTNVKITSLAFSEENTALFIGTSDSIIILKIEYDNPHEKNGAWKSFCLIGHQGIVTDIAYAPNGAYFVSTDHKGTSYKWNKKSNKPNDSFEPEKIPLDHTIQKIFISPDSNFIFFKKNNDSGSLFDIVHRSLEVRDGNIIAFAPGNRLIVLTTENTLEIYDLFRKKISSFCLPSLEYLSCNTHFFETTGPCDSNRFLLL